MNQILMFFNKCHKFLFVCWFQRFYVGLILGRYFLKLLHWNVTQSFSILFSSKAEGRSLGMNLIKIGSKIAPPGSIKIARLGMDLIRSIICSCICCCSSLLRSLTVDSETNFTKSLLSFSSWYNRLLFLEINFFTILEVRR